MEADSASCRSPLLELDILINWLGAGPGMEWTECGWVEAMGGRVRLCRTRSLGTLGSRTTGLAQRLSPLE